MRLLGRLFLRRTIFGLLRRNLLCRDVRHLAEIGRCFEVFLELCWRIHGIALFSLRFVRSGFSEQLRDHALHVEAGIKLAKARYSVRPGGVPKVLGGPR